MAQDIFPAVG